MAAGCSWALNPVAVLRAKALIALFVAAALAAGIEAGVDAHASPLLRDPPARAAEGRHPHHPGAASATRNSTPGGSISQVATDLLRARSSVRWRCCSRRQAHRGPLSALEVADIFRLRAGVASRPARSPEPRAVEGHVGHRTVPHCGAGGMCCAVRPASRSTLQLVQPALPGVRRTPSVGSGPGRRTCCRLSITTWFTLPAPISALAYTNKALVYRRCSRSPPRRCSPSPPIQHLGATIGATLVLHTWGSAMTHHPHVHGIVPGGGLSADGQRWIARLLPAFFLPVRVLSRLFRRRFLERAGEGASRRRAALLRRVRPAGTTGRVPALARAAVHERMGRLCQAALRPAPRRCSPTCRATPIGWRSRTVAWVSLDAGSVSFRWKDCRQRARRHKTMTSLPRSSCAASCCTLLPCGFTASGTTDCSPTQDGGSTKRAREVARRDAARRSTRHPRWSQPPR